MVETDEEEEDLVDEMQCLPEDLATAMGSVKRSLLETLDSVESVQKKKPSVKNSPVWGQYLQANRQLGTMETSRSWTKLLHI